MTSSPASPRPPGSPPARPPQAGPGTGSPAASRVSRTSVSRTAELQLRGSAGPLPTRVYWPSPSTSPSSLGRPGLLVFFPEARAYHVSGDAAGADTLCRELCAGAGLVVVSVGYRTSGSPPAPDNGVAGIAFEDATTATQWSADHAAELGADPGRLLVGGEGFGADLAVAVARHAREQGWPPITLQVLVSAEQAAAPAVLVDWLRRRLEGGRR
jgi:acetyl esterase